MNANLKKYALNELIEIKHGWAFKGAHMSEDLDEGPIVVAIGNYDYSGGFRFESTRKKRYTGNYPSEYKLSPGDILLAMTCQTAGGEILEIPGVIPDDGNVYLHNQRLGKVIIKRPDVVCADYLYWIFLTKAFNNFICSSATGTKILHTAPSKIEQFEWEFPLLDEQERIASVLWSLVKKISNNTKTNQTLESIAQAIFKSWFVDFDPVKAKIEAKQTGRDPLLAAMSAISGKSEEQIQSMKKADRQQLQSTAELFPDALVESEIGVVPEGWGAEKVGDILTRLKPKKIYTKKQVEPYGSVPVFEQGAGILLGYHDCDPGFIASPDDPIFIFGDHTCIMHLSCSNFDISSNVIPLKSKSRPTLWTFYALRGLQEFQEYRRHWSELIVKEVVMPCLKLTELYSNLIRDSILLIEENQKQDKSLEQIRDTLLPRLLSGELNLHTPKPELEQAV